MAGGHDLAMRLRVAYMALHRRTNAAFAGFGLTADQFVLLTALAEEDGVTQKELVRRTGSDPNTMSEMLARLESRGLILRRRHASDGRARSVGLTEEGRRIQARLWEASAPLRGELERPFDPEALQTLVDQLGLIAEAMGSAHAAPSPGGPRPGP